MSNRGVQIGLALIVIAIFGFIFGDKNIGGLFLGTGGLVLIYVGFKLFWRWLEKRYE